MIGTLSRPQKHDFLSQTVVAGRAPLASPRPDLHFFRIEIALSQIKASIRVKIAIIHACDVTRADPLN